ncbi:MAG TPA: M28 family peptidase [Solirubrobacteraceae bacterium]|nr:M28 family peptidase [Solirubrobacteraceae bacterium]
MAAPPPDPPSADDAPDVSAEVRELIDRLAALPRAPGSPGEAKAAELFAAALREAGARAEVQPATYLPGYAAPIGALCGLATLTGLATVLRGGRRGRGRRRRGTPTTGTAVRQPGAAALATLIALAIADDVSNALRLVRRLAGPRPTQNVVAEIGDPAAPRTLVILGHHDAAPTGLIFSDDLQMWAGRRCPGLIERMDTGLPLWWAVILGPLLLGLGAWRGQRSLQLAGTLWSAIDSAAFLDIAASPTVPGANDNLSALGAELGVARRLADSPIPGLRVLLVSCGAEEVIQGGINTFVRRHLAELDPHSTWVLNLDTVGSPELVMLEGEGALLMEDYHHRPFRELIARVSDGAGAPLRRGLRARNSTDAVIPSRAGFPTATLTSVNRAKALTHYHKLSDVPENLHWRTIAHTILVCELVARELATNPWLS